jgi:hypothetical protein
MWHNVAGQFGLPCRSTCFEANELENWLEKPNHPETNGQVERTTRPIEDATVKQYYYDRRASCAQI